MSDKLRCEIVRDLLPSYVEGLTSQTTNEAVEEHLTGCPDCDAMAKRMKSPEPEPEQQRQQTEEVDYLKGIKRRNWAKIVETAVLVAVVVGLLFWGGRHLVGREADERVVDCGITVDGNTVVLSGSFLTDDMASGGVSWTEDGNGVVTARIKWVEPSVLFFSDKEIHSQFETSEEVRQVRLGDLILWEDGVTIEPAVSRIYAAAHPYIGDMPANGELAAALGIADRLGTFTHKLQTTEEPYGWTICLDEPFSLDEEWSNHIFMDDYSCVMLALVDNLGYVTWERTDETGTKSYTVTAEQAAGMTGQDIKSWGQSAVKFQELTNELGLNYTVSVGIAYPYSEEASIQIRSESERPIRDVTLHYSYEGEVFSTTGVCNADEGSDVFGHGETLTFALTREDFDMLLTPVELAEVTFDLYVTDMEGTEYLAAEEVCPGLLYGWGYSYTIVDDGNGGFELKAN